MMKLYIMHRYLCSYFIFFAIQESIIKSASCKIGYQVSDNSKVICLQFFLIIYIRQANCILLFHVEYSFFLLVELYFDFCILMILLNKLFKIYNRDKYYVVKYQAWFGSKLGPGCFKSTDPPIQLKLKGHYKAKMELDMACTN